MVVGNNESTATKMQVNHWQFRLPWRCCAPQSPGCAPSVECLHRIAIAPAAAMVNKFDWNTQNTKKTQLTASNYGIFWSLVVCENFNPKTDPLLSSLMQQASFKCEMSWFQLKSLCTYLAIKRCQRTKFRKVIKLTRSSIKNGRITVTIGVKLLTA